MSEGSASGELAQYQDPRAIWRVVDTASTVAVVGLSANPLRPSNAVGGYLQQRGYRVIPVNLREPEILGETCYPSLAEVPEHVDVVDVFRAPAALPAIARESRSVPWTAASKSSTPVTLTGFAGSVGHDHGNLTAGWPAAMLGGALTA